MNFKAGTRLVVLGDVADTRNLITFCDQADALVMEATYLESEADMANQFGHMTAKGSAELALKAGVQQLILTMFHAVIVSGIFCRKHNKFSPIRLLPGILMYLM